MSVADGSIVETCGVLSYVGPAVAVAVDVITVTESAAVSDEVFVGSRLLVVVSFTGVSTGVVSVGHCKLAASSQGSQRERYLVYSDECVSIHASTALVQLDHCDDNDAGGVMVWQPEAVMRISSGIVGAYVARLSARLRQTEVSLLGVEVLRGKT
ncbi:uncharacterized protein SPSK_02806 [Sporothrix schenckii 1099-18]|uniref:Uncharacterized protein n=1 Tax=Sporothrix schenckii 1099-18 TaxID=1397361 RepID=A0A0F2MAV2_SPOSC|nr:uncharacterized protein SPSK_02806 [Sporothrix schenckii 1099-18]KJR86828.1 hypothetical protein SPSK_02806 [Sporothrix schenckii 1099-18]